LYVLATDSVCGEIVNVNVLVEYVSETGVMRVTLATVGSRAFGGPGPVLESKQDQKHAPELEQAKYTEVEIAHLTLYSPLFSLLYLALTLYLRMAVMWWAPLPTWNRYNLAVLLLRVGQLRATTAGTIRAAKVEASRTADKLKVTATS